MLDNFTQLNGSGPGYEQNTLPNKILRQDGVMGVEYSNFLPSYFENVDFILKFF